MPYYYVDRQCIKCKKTMKLNTSFGSRADKICLWCIPYDEKVKRFGLRSCGCLNIKANMLFKQFCCAKLKAEYDKLCAPTFEDNFIKAPLS